jgi:hypothetical protein
LSAGGGFDIHDSIFDIRFFKVSFSIRLAAFQVRGGARGSGFQPRKKVALQLSSHDRGWKPLPQSKSHKLLYIPMDS